MWAGTRRHQACCLPNSLVIGPQRAGTSWLLRYLESRGDVGVPRGVKETFFFDHSYRRGLKWYSGHFRGAEGKRRVIEVASTYFHSTEAPGRVFRDLGPVPLICTLRHPAKRAFSLHLHLQRYGAEPRPFREAVTQQPLLRDSSRYATNLERWIETFGRENILVLFLETLAEDPNLYARQLCDHLDLPFRELAPSLHGPVNQAATPNSNRLARAAAATADLARYLGLYTLIDLAKTVGLKDAVFGRPGTTELPKLSDEDCTWFMSTIEQEVDELEKLLETDLSPWRTRTEAAVR